VNLLHRMGRHPRLDTIRAGRRSDEKQGFDQLVRRVEFSLGSLSEDERGDGRPDDEVGEAGAGRRDESARGHGAG
jgi:hypothetical protein